MFKLFKPELWKINIFSKNQIIYQYTKKALISEIAVCTNPNKVINLRINFPSKDYWRAFEKSLKKNQILTTDGYYPNNFTKPGGITVCWESNDDDVSNTIKMGISVSREQIKEILKAADEFCPFSKTMKKNLITCLKEKLFEKQATAQNAEEESLLPSANEYTMS